MVKKIEHHLKSQCPVACSLDVIGDHWSLLIVRELMFNNNHEYKGLMTIREGISTNILSDRLRKLENADVIDSIPHPEGMRRKLYYLTAKGRDLIYIMLEISRWADRNIADWIAIPEDHRLFVDVPTKRIASMVFKKLDAWENEHL